MKPPIPNDRWRTLSAALDELLDLAPEKRVDWIGSAIGLSDADRSTLRAMVNADGSFATGIALDAKPVAERALDREFSLPSAQKIGSYLLVRKLADGGMSSVWLAERSNESSDPAAVDATRAQYAIKRPHSGLIPGNLERFRQEGEILASLSHPNIAGLVEMGIEDGAPFLVLTYVRGQPITDYAQTNQLSLEQRLQLFAQVLSAVQYAHGRLVLHRDLKPSNIFVTDAGEARLLDFGVAKLIAESDAVDLRGDVTLIYGRAMTPLYASPEQLRGEALTIASDVYSLGLVLYELLTDKRLRNDDGGGATAVLAKALASHPPKASDARAKSVSPSVVTSTQLKGDIDAIIGKALALDPSERYTTVEAFAEDIRRFLDHKPVRAQAPTVRYRVSRFFKRYRVATSIALLSLTAVLVTTTLAIWQAKVANEERNWAQNQSKRRGQATDFLVGLIAQYRSPAQPITTLALLEGGLDRIPIAFKEDWIAASLMAHTLSWRIYELGALEKAERGLVASLEYARRSQDVATIVDATSSLAEYRAKRNQKDEAYSLLADARRQVGGIQERQRREIVAANILFDASSIAAQFGDAKTAVATASELVELRIKQPDVQGISNSAAWGRLAAAQTIAMDFDSAVASRDKALEHVEKSGARDSTNHQSAQSARLETILRAGDAALAVSSVTSIAAADDDAVALTTTAYLARAARAYAMYGDGKVAQRLLDLADQRTGRSNVDDALLNLARFEICIASSDAACAQRLESSAVNAFELLYAQNSAMLAGRHWCRAISAYLSGEVTRASDEIDRGLAMIATHVDAPSIYSAKLLLVRGRVMLTLNNLDGAAAATANAQSYFDKHHRYAHEKVIDAIEALALQAEIARARGDSDLSRSNAAQAHRRRTQYLSESHDLARRIAKLTEAAQN